MKSVKKIYTDQRFTLVFLILSIILIAFLLYRGILDYFFSFNDELGCIYQGRFQSLRDIFRIFTESCYEGTFFSSSLYCPTVVLSCGLDYSIWKLNPFGYHLTNLIIHIMSSISIFFLAVLLTRGNKFAAWLGAIIFTIHHVHLYSVTNISDRSDALAGLFIILSFFLFLKYLSTMSYKRYFLLFSIFSYIIAFGSKEIAIILPLLIFSYLIIFSDEASPKDRTVQAIKIAAPYLIVTLVLLFWRAYAAVGTLVGGHPPPVFFQNIVVNYFYFLIVPGDFPFQKLHSPVNHVFIPLLVPLIFLMLFYRRTISGERLKLLSKTIIAGIILSSSVILAIFFDWLLNNNNYQGMWHLFHEGTGIIYFLGAKRALFLNRLYYLLLLFLICLIWIIYYNKRGHSSPVSYKDKLITFLIIWFLMPLSVYSYAGFVARWYLYIPLIPFSILLSYIFIEGVNSIKRKSRGHPFLFRRTIPPIIIGVLMLFFLINSPARRIKGWKPNVKPASIFLNNLLEVAPKLPNDSYLFVNIPKEILVLNGPAIKTWLDIAYPNNKIKAIFTDLPLPQDRVVFEIQLSESNAIKISVMSGTK